MVKRDEGKENKIQNLVDFDTPLKKNVDALSDTSTKSLALKRKSLCKIYEKCNFVKLESSSYEETGKYKEQKQVIQVEISIFKKNETWSLVNKLE